MRLADYPRPPADTGIGVHLSPNFVFPMGEYQEHWPYWLEQLRSLGVTWATVMSGGAGSLDLVKFLLTNGIMPIVRFYPGLRPPAPMLAADPMSRDAVARFTQAGARYFVWCNEPNLLEEWPGPRNEEGVPETWQALNPRQPEAVADAWCQDARFILQQGGLPGTPPMSPGGDYDSEKFLDAFLARVKETGHGDIMASGAWLSCHNAALNHPIGYPFDDVNQGGTPLQDCEYGAHKWATRNGGMLTEEQVNAERVKGMNPDQKILDPGASNGWLKFLALHELALRYDWDLPVLSCEGGFVAGSGEDPRYHVLSDKDVAERTTAVAAAMMAGEYPAYYLCTGFWLLAAQRMGGGMRYEPHAWFTAPDGERLVVAAMRVLPKQNRPIPPSPAGCLANLWPVRR